MLLTKINKMNIFGQIFSGQTMRLYTIILSFLLFCLTNGALAVGITGKWNERYSFSSITQEDGLPSNFVDDILKDSQGFIWIATRGGGVARYDGYGFVVFDMGSSSRKLRSNFVSSLCEDGFNRIWTAGDSGIDIISEISLRKAEVLANDPAFQTVCSMPVERLLKSDSGNIWIGADYGLTKVILSKNGDIEHIINVCSVTSGEHLTLLADIDGWIWMASAEGICRVREDAMNEQTPQLVSPALSFNDRTVQVARKRDKEVWIGTDKGLIRYNLETGLEKSYSYEAGNDYSLTQNYVTDIAETDDHTMVVATLRGINLYNSFTDKFERINSDTGENDRTGYNNSLNCDFVNCMLSDNGLLWIGTEIGGLNKMGRRRLLVRNWWHDPNSKGSLSKNPVNAIYEDKAGNLWVGTVEGGLNRLVHGSREFIHYTTDAPAFLSHNSVSCFADDHKGKLWVGTWGKGFGWVNLDRLQDMRFRHIAFDGMSDFSEGLVGVLCCDTINNLLWVGTSQNVYVYDPQLNSAYEPFAGMNLGGVDGCTGYCFDTQGHLWLGMAAGLCRIDLHSLGSGKLEFKLLKYKLDEPDSKLKERVNGVIQAKDGTIWVGSNGYGLYEATVDDTGEFSFRAFTTDNGLANNCVRSLAEDDEGRIWVITANGLSCFEPLTEHFVNYTTRDGLLSDIYYWNAILKASSGNIYLGSVDGLSVVRPSDNFYDYSNEPALAFTNLFIANEECFFPSDATVKMHERDKQIVIEFASLDYDALPYAAYSYRLLGFDDEWVKAAPSHRTASFTNLKAGNYTFQLRYAPDGEHWLGITRELHLKVQPYFYKTVWFALIMTFILIFLIVEIMEWRVREVKAQREKLQDMVEQRTRQLQEEKRKVQELTLDKISFFTNITHEFRTPLTLIVGPVERALKLSYNPKVIEQLKFIEHNSKYLLSLINQLMDFRKVESGKMEIALNAGNFLSLLGDIVCTFEAYASERNVSLRRCFRLTNCEMMFDGEAIHKIIVNLISNALKFTPEGGTITVYSTILHKHNGDLLYLSVADTGTGIAEDDLEKVFDRYYQSKKNPPQSVVGQSGTGIGLYLCQQIVEMHGGKIWVKNNKGPGCSFRLFIPVKYAQTASQALDTNHAATNHPVAQQNNNSGTTFAIAHQNNLSKTEMGNEQQSDAQISSSDETESRLAILVVEDNKDMRDYIRSILTDQYDVLEASQGEEALQVLRIWNVDFIISDLMMPVMDGIELSRKVKSDFLTSHIPFLMLTAKTSDEARLESYNIGVDEYLLKPFDDKLLLARIANILENKKRLQNKFSFSMNLEELKVEDLSNDKKFLDRAMQVVKENYKDSYYEIADFVEAMGVSKSLMNKKMQSLTGQSAGQFLRNYRLNVARELILQNRVTRNMNISEIAYEVGFNDPKYFTRCFTKHFGAPPSSLFNLNS